MSFSIMNANVVSTFVGDVGIGGADTPFMMLPTGNAYPLFSTPGVVDVTGMEFAISLVTVANTAKTQTIASVASTLELMIGDGGTTATAAASDNFLIDADSFSNTVTGGWTIHEAKTAGGATTSTDLDSDDFVNLHITANASDIAGAVMVKAAYVNGKPGSIS